MSQHQHSDAMPVDSSRSTQQETVTFPAPTRGLILNENESYMQPGGAVVLDNWKPTMKGAALRGGCALWATLPETTPIISGFSYASGINHQMFVGNATKLYDVTTTRRRDQERSALRQLLDVADGQPGRRLYDRRQRRRRPAAPVRRHDMDDARPRRSDQLGQQHVLHQRPAGTGRGRWQSMEVRHQPYQPPERHLRR